MLPRGGLGGCPKLPLLVLSGKKSVAAVAVYKNGAIWWYISCRTTKIIL